MSAALSQLTELAEAPADDDFFGIVDASDTTKDPHSDAGSNKRVLVSNAAKAFLRKAQVLVIPTDDNDAADNATAVNDAITALGGTGIVKLAPVAWNIACGTIVHDGSGLYLDLAGCTVTASGAGDLIDMHDSSDFGSRTVHGGGVKGFPQLDGSACTGNSCAVHMGDIFGADCDVQAWNFTAGTTSKGVWFDNRYFFAEALHARVFANNCTAGIVFDVNSGATATGAHTAATGSFERAVLDLQVNQGAASQDGFVFQHGAFVQDGIVSLHGNFVTSASALTSAVLRLNGATPSGITDASVSNISNSVLNVGCECDTTSGSHAPMTVNFGTTDNFITSCTGNVNFGAAAAFTSSNNAGQVAGFVGVIAGDANLPASLPFGSTNIADSNQVMSSTSATAITNLAAPVAAFTAYKIEIYIPHTGAGTNGPFVFALGGPSIALASLDAELSTGTVLTAATRNGSTSTLMSANPVNATQRVLKVTGTIALSSAGTLTVTGAKSSGGSNVTVDIGAYILLTPLSAP